MYSHLLITKRVKAKREKAETIMIAHLLILKIAGHALEHPIFVSSEKN